MKIISLNMIWPAIYVVEALSKFWFLVIGTIVIELFVIKYFLKFSWKKSFIISLIGNCISGFVGTYTMLVGMLFWHLLVDWMMPDGTFDTINWYATFILMCLGSVLLETLAIKFIYKEKIKRLFLPMLVGNILSYGFIAIVMIKDANEKEVYRTEKVQYLPNKQQFILLDKSFMSIDTSSISIDYNKDGKCLTLGNSTGYALNIPFKKQYKDSFQFNLKLINEEYASGMQENSADINVNKIEKEYKILLEQKNIDTSLGWKKPIITDTIVFKKLIKGSH